MYQLTTSSSICGIRTRSSQFDGTRINILQLEILKEQTGMSAKFVNSMIEQAQKLGQSQSQAIQFLLARARS